MTTPDPTSSEPLQEALSVDTSPERLQELYRAHSALRSVMASNPSAPIKLLDELALQCPTEVLANPVLQLRAFETCGPYGEFSLQSLVCLCLVCDPKRDPDLLQEIRWRIRACLDELRGKEWISLTCVWLYQRTFTLRPDDCDGLIDQQLELKVEMRAYVDGHTNDISSAIPSLVKTDPSPVYLRRSQLSKLLETIATGELDQYIDSCIDPDGDRVHKGDSRTLLKATNLPKGYAIEGSSLYKDDAHILAFVAVIHESDSIHCVNGVISVAVGEHEEIDRVYDLPLGDLKQFKLFAANGMELPFDWPARLSALLIP